MNVLKVFLVACSLVRAEAGHSPGAPYINQIVSPEVFQPPLTPAAPELYPVNIIPSGVPGSLYKEPAHTNLFDPSTAHNSALTSDSSNVFFSQRYVSGVASNNAGINSDDGFENPISTSQSSKQFLTLIKKYVYFHSPPPDFEDAPLPNPPPSTKNYNIIFIKAPSTDTLKQQQEQNEDKTLIYVLVKKPDGLPEPVRKDPMKPEVYYVKYNAVRGDDESEDDFPVARGFDPSRAALASADADIRYTPQYLDY